MRGLAVLKILIYNKIQSCGYGGIGRRAGFRFQWATVQVQILLPAPRIRALLLGLLLFSHGAGFEPRGGLSVKKTCRGHVFSEERLDRYRGAAGVCRADSAHSARSNPVTRTSAGHKWHAAPSRSVLKFGILRRSIRRAGTVVKSACTIISAKKCLR